MTTELFDLTNLSVEDLTSLINSQMAKIDEQAKKDKEEHDAIMAVWVKQELLENPDADTIQVTRSVNAKFLNSYTTVNTDPKKCIEDCSKCKYLNHKTASSRTCKKYGNVSMRTAILEKGADVDYTLQAHLANQLEKLNEEVMTGKFFKKITTQSNDKLEGIPTLNMPNIFLQVSFMKFVEKNKKYLEMPAVALLYAYFKKYAMCKNCQYCNGLCYNNKLLVQYKDKSISELRNLLGYILKREQLAEKITAEMGNNRLFRIHGNGEFHSMENLEFWIDIVKANPQVKFYTYTKSYELLEEYLQAGNKLPKNLVLNVSMVEGQQAELEEKYPALMQNNKFVIILEKEKAQDKKATICGGACLRCEKGCHTKLRTENKYIYVIIH